ncbi:glycosyltransferase family 2 protein [Natrinema sp. 74]|uniref:glycosyltransferase family 2 protein n=1 Tax=Natrinema sp. 74 TaxID=3384159 RepID=UPI0038D4B55F
MFESLSRSTGSVSVVIPTYFRNDRLRTAIDSARAQDPPPYEVIVVDGSGEAHAEPVARETGVTYVAQAEDRGAQAARDAGAKRAGGEYVQFLDDDDRLLPGKFRKQLPLFDDGVGVVYSGIRDEEWGEILPDEAVRGNVVERALALNTFPCIPSTMLLEREVVESLRPLRHRHGADDSGMKIELALRTKFDYVDAPLVERGKPPETLSSSWDHVEGRKRIIATYAELYARAPDAVRERALQGTYHREGKKHLEERPWSPGAVRSFARAAAHEPDEPVRELGICLGSLFGRPGVRAAEAVLP